ncbi:ABC transporter ATP-binding protein [Striga asiatica]|uniref:ABC transporter ATP-binding protein n=1 Tax=Striga asiatica TaxID=4170 RepID=A0A5A7QCB5_STRAF|nr:ABC transporter ATP-binding protein [Striga asiatica]
MVDHILLGNFVVGVVDLTSPPKLLLHVLNIHHILKLENGQGSAQMPQVPQLFQPQAASVFVENNFWQSLEIPQCLSCPDAVSLRGSPMCAAACIDGDSYVKTKSADGKERSNCRAT